LNIVKREGQGKQRTRGNDGKRVEKKRGKNGYSTSDLGKIARKQLSEYEPNTNSNDRGAQKP